MPVDLDDGPVGTIDKLIGETLRAARKIAQFSGADVERISGGQISQTALMSYERGERRITVERLVAICQVYRRSPSALVGEIERQVHA